MLDIDRRRKKWQIMFCFIYTVFYSEGLNFSFLFSSQKLRGKTEQWVCDEMRCHSEEEEKIALLVFPSSSPFVCSEGIQALQSHLVTEFVLLLHKNRSDSKLSLAVQRQTTLKGHFPYNPCINNAVWSLYGHFY